MNACIIYFFIIHRRSLSWSLILFISWKVLTRDKNSLQYYYQTFNRESKQIYNTWAQINIKIKNGSLTIVKYKQAGFNGLFKFKQLFYYPISMIEHFILDCHIEIQHKYEFVWTWNLLTWYTVTHHYWTMLTLLEWVHAYIYSNPYTSVNLNQVIIGSVNIHYLPK